eukprot:TCONS_00061874-protein
MADLSARRQISESLRTQSWQQVSIPKDDTTIDRGQDLVLKYYFDRLRHSYDIIVYDGKTLRHESVANEEDFLAKNKLFNPNLEAESTSILNELSYCLQQCQKELTGLSFQVEEDVLKMNIKTKLKSGIPFAWTFTLKEATTHMIIEHLVQPLAILTSELNRRQQELFYMLERKDRELQDYKDQGAVASRRHLETVQFDRVNFQTSSNVHQTFLDSCTNPTLNSLTKDLKDLHRNVVLNTASKVLPAEAAPREQQKAGPSMSTFDTVPIVPGRGEDISSWVNEKRIGGSFVQDQLDAGKDPLQPDPDTQPVVVTEALSPQEEELKRREALKKKLNEQTEKKAKKKRKIKL